MRDIKNLTLGMNQDELIRAEDFIRARFVANSFNMLEVAQKIYEVDSKNGWLLYTGGDGLPIYGKGEEWGADQFKLGYLTYYRLRSIGKCMPKLVSAAPEAVIQKLDYSNLAEVINEVDKTEDIGRIRELISMVQTGSQSEIRHMVNPRAQIYGTIQLNFTDRNKNEGTFKIIKRFPDISPETIWKLFHGCELKFKFTRPKRK